MSFDYGTGEDIKESGKAGNDKIVPKGDYAARLVGIVHLGVCPKRSFDGKSVDMLPQAVALFELVDTDESKDIFETDGETHQILTKDFTLKKGGGKSDMDKIIAMGDSEATGFDTLIDNVYTLKVVHSNCGKYANIAGFSKGGLAPYPKKFWKSENESQCKIGHVTYDNLNKEAIESLHAWNHIADLLLKGPNYAGSKAEAVVEAIRAEEGREDFGKKVRKADKEEAKEPAPKLEEGGDAKASDY